MDRPAAKDGSWLAVHLICILQQTLNIGRNSDGTELWTWRQTWVTEMCWSSWGPALLTRVTQCTSHACTEVPNYPCWQALAFNHDTAVLARLFGAHTLRLSIMQTTSTTLKCPTTVTVTLPNTAASAHVFFIYKTERTRRMAIANGTCVSFCSQPKAEFGYHRRVTPVCRCLHPFCGWRHIATSRESKARIGLSWVRPWDNRGKFYMDGKRIQSLSNASQHVPIFLHSSTVYEL